MIYKSLRCIVVALPLLAVGACVGGCSTSVQVDDAMELGRVQAAELCRLADEDADLCPILLDIKATEAEMRLYGLDEAADSFLNTVEVYVSDKNPSLAEDIFDR